MTVKIARQRGTARKRKRKEKIEMEPKKGNGRSNYQNVVLRLATELESYHHNIILKLSIY